MAFPLIAAGIAAGSGVLQGVMKAEAEKKKQKRAESFQQLQAAQGRQFAAPQTLSQGQIQALQNIVSGQQRALLR